MRSTTSAAAVLLVTFLGSAKASAQCTGSAGTCTTNSPASVTIGSLVELGMSSATTTLTAPTADQVDVGAAIDDPGPTFTIKANRRWTLNIKSGNATTWTYVGSNGGSKPISDLTWSKAVAGPYRVIKAAGAKFLSGARATAGTAAAVFFRTNYPAGFTNAANAPGVYSLPIVFTLTAP